MLILIIVFGHFAYYVEAPVFKLFHELGTSAVAMFFFISGFGCVRSWQHKGRDYLNGFFRLRIPGILLPAIIILVVHSCLRQKILMPPQYWFLFVIIFDYLLFWFCYRFLKSYLHIPVLWIGSLLFMVITILLGFDRCWWICGLTYPAGCMFAYKESYLAKESSDNPLRFFAWLTASLLLFAGAYVTHEPLIWPLSYVGITLAIAFIVSMIPLDQMKLPVLGFIGSISYEIYLSHITVIEFLQSFHSITTHSWIFIMAALLLTVVVSYMVKRLSVIILRK